MKFVTVRFLKLQRVYVKDFNDLIMWILLGTMAFWAVAKLFGWINTPLLIEVYPVIAATVFGFNLLYKLARLMARFERMEDDLHSLKHEFIEFRKEVTAELREHDRMLIRIEAKLA
jgi:hypothetical protein